MRKVKERESQKEKVFNEKNVPVKALWKMEKFKDVQSKIKDLIQVKRNKYHRLSNNAAGILTEFFQSEV